MISLHLPGRACRGTVLVKQIVVTGYRDFQPWKNMVPEDLVVDILVDFLVGLEEVGKHLAAVGYHYAENHDLNWMFGSEGPLDLSS
uniref:Uncharacterized protein n=1 Tax=Lepeophtheirus salmonis TaxID=72036 RepID=A0A0K2URA4_LEPSM